MYTITCTFPHAYTNTRTLTHSLTHMYQLCMLTYAYTHTHTRLGAVAESVEDGSRAREIVGFNPWSSQANDL